jgi:serine phosphatase RsbU (regulator of sigma subunit)
VNDLWRSVDEQHPWPGLLSFTERDREFFFGRDDEVEELLGLITNYRLSVLYGASGLGKSSLLNAGLFPRLRARNYLPVRVRLEVSPGAPSASDQLKGALAATILATGADAPAMVRQESLWEYLHRGDHRIWSARHDLLTPVFVLDQFEEMFSRIPRSVIGDRVRDEIVQTVGDLSEGRPPNALKRAVAGSPELAEQFAFADHWYRVLIAIREDFLADLDDLSNEIASLRQSRMRLTHMRGSKAIGALVAAAKPAGILAPEVAFSIVRFVGESTASVPDTKSLAALPIEPALLSVVCYELNEERIREGGQQIAIEQLEQTDAILMRFYADAVLDAPELLLEFIEKHLITADGVREMVAYERIRALPNVTDDDIARLIDRRILRIEHRQGRRLVELTHDRLAPVVYETRERRRKRESVLSDELGEDVIEAGTLLQAVVAVGKSRTLADVLSRIIDAAIELTGTDRGCVVLGDDVRDLVVKVARVRGFMPVSSGTIATHRSIVEEVFRTGHARVVNDVATAADPEKGRDLVHGRHVVCVPLTQIRYTESAEQWSEGPQLGVLYLDRRQDQIVMSGGRFERLEMLAAQASIAVVNAGVDALAFERARMEQEMRIAAEIQQALLPKASRAGAFFSAAAASVPCRSIGGDFYDYVDVGDGSLGFALGDVAGKGPPAALLSAMVQGMFAGQAAATSEPPSETVWRFNLALYRRGIESRFVTLMYGVLDPDGRMTYCNAGHTPPPFIFGESGVTRLERGGPIVGLFEGATYEGETLRLSAGDWLVIVSDGVSEAMSASGDEYGEARIIDCVQRNRDLAPSQLLDALFGDVGEFSRGTTQSDDMTAMALRYLE